jgi:hypothetical protein
MLGRGELTTYLPEPISCSHADKFVVGSIRDFVTAKIATPKREPRPSPPQAQRRGLWRKTTSSSNARRPSAQWNDDDFDVLANGVVVGRIFKANASPVGASWMWTLAFGHHKDRSPTHGYEATREDAMTAFAKSRRRE